MEVMHDDKEYELLPDGKFIQINGDLIRLVIKGEDIFIDFGTPKKKPVEKSEDVGFSSGVRVALPVEAIRGLGVFLTTFYNEHIEKEDTEKKGRA